MLSAANNFPPEHPANYVLMMLVSMSDPGMLVLATHRLFRGLPSMTSAQLEREASAKAFDTLEPAGTGARTTPVLVWARDPKPKATQNTAMAFYTAKDRRMSEILARTERQRPCDSWPRSPPDHSVRLAGARC